MARWMKMKNGIVGMVVAKLKLESGLIFGLDVNGLGGIFYVAANEVRDLEPLRTRAAKLARTPVPAK